MEEIPYYYDRSQLIDLLCLEGDDAVEPLLACLESDNRLTRAYLSDKPYPRAVYPLAEEALETILEIPFRQFDSEDGTPRHEEDGIAVRQALARRIRAYWDRYKGLSLPERWYRMLADDQADARDWFVAAGHVVCPASLPLSERGGLWSWQYEALQLTYKEKLHGDILRSKAGPSVAELMAKRAKELNARRATLDAEFKEFEARRLRQGAPFGQESKSELKELEKQREVLQRRESTLVGSRSDGFDMALYLAKWDPAAAVPVLRADGFLPLLIAERLLQALAWVGPALCRARRSRRPGRASRICQMARRSHGPRGQGESGVALVYG